MANIFGSILLTNERKRDGKGEERKIWGVFVLYFLSVAANSTLETH